MLDSDLVKYRQLLVVVKLEMHVFQCGLGLHKALVLSKKFPWLESVESLHGWGLLIGTSARRVPSKPHSDTFLRKLHAGGNST